MIDSPDAPSAASYEVCYIERARQVLSMTLCGLGVLGLIALHFAAQLAFLPYLDGLASWVIALTGVALPALFLIWFLTRHGFARGRLSLTEDAWEFHPARWTVAYPSTPIRREWDELTNLSFSGVEGSPVAHLRMTRAPHHIMIRLHPPRFSAMFKEDWILLARRARELHPEMCPLSEDPQRPSLVGKAFAWIGLVWYVIMSSILLASGEMDTTSIFRLVVLGSVLIPVALKAIRRH